MFFMFELVYTIYAWCHADHHLHSDLNGSTLSQNPFLLWWEHSHKAQVSIQLFDEQDNYFNHMPRLTTAPDLSPAPGRDGLEPSSVCHWQTIFIDVFFIHYLLLYLSLFALFFIISILAIPSTTHLPPSTTTHTHSQFLLPPTPTPIPFTWLCRARVGESVTMETGAEAVEGSLWERERGGKERKTGSCGRCRGIHEWSSDANLVQ